MVYVCICAAVTEAQVRACITTGASTTEEIGARCAAGTGCGSCLDRLDDLLVDIHAGRVDEVRAVVVRRD